MCDNLPGEIGTNGPSPPYYFLLPKITKKYSFSPLTKKSMNFFPPFCHPYKENTILWIIIILLWFEKDWNTHMPCGRKESKGQKKMVYFSILLHKTS